MSKNLKIGRSQRQQEERYLSRGVEFPYNRPILILHGNEIGLALVAAIDYSKYHSVRVVRCRALQEIRCTSL